MFNKIIFGNKLDAYNNKSQLMNIKIIMKAVFYFLIKKGGAYDMFY